MVEPRRYDTRFFAAALPPGQRTRDVGGEADEVAWVRRPRHPAARGRELLLFPPTAVCLAELAACGGWPPRSPRRGTSAPVIPEVAVAGGDGLADRPPGPGVPAVTAAGGQERVDGAGTPGPAACSPPTRAR